MPIKLIHFESGTYPHFQSTGNAARFAIPYAAQVCTGNGVDIGCGKLEWCFPGAIPVDPAISNHDAYSFPYIDLDYVFSSHCLEHLPYWVEALTYWHKALKIGGVLFLYLPDYSQEYWRPWNNKKHLHIFTPQIIRDALLSLNLTNVFVSGVDLNNSFMAMGEK